MAPKKLALAATAFVLVLLIAVVWFANLDGLPRSVREDIKKEKTAFAQAQKQFQKVRDEVTTDIRQNPALFQSRSMVTVLPERLNQAEVTLREVGNTVIALNRIEKDNRKRDRQQAELLVHQSEAARAKALQQATEVETEANRWVSFKKNLPAALQTMQQEYQSVQGADLASVTSAVQKAEADWPAKKSDLDTRLEGLKKLSADAEKQWQETAPLRAKAAAEDVPALAAAADTIHEAATSVKQRSETLRNLTGQLYNAYDKVLVDLDKGDDFTYKEKLKTVTTHFTDVAANKSEVLTAENWVQVSPETYRGHEKDVGMTVEHKAAGKYDSEADKVAQPPGFGYIAKPEEGRNRYGYWNNSGGVPAWVWFPAFYSLRNSFWGGGYYSAPSVVEYHNYYTTHTAGQSYYGVDSTTNRPKYGSQSVDTATRYSSSKYASKGGFTSSKYASGGSTAGGTRYGSSGSTFGQGTRYGSKSSGTYRSSPSFGSRSSGGGRRFGGRR